MCIRDSYNITLAAGTSQDLAGNSYAGTSTYDFSTAADTTAPTVTTFSPSDGATGVATSSNIVLSFSEPIAGGIGSLLLKTAAGATVETFDPATSNRLTILRRMLPVPRVMGSLKLSTILLLVATPVAPSPGLKVVMEMCIRDRFLTVRPATTR